MGYLNEDSAVFNKIIIAVAIGVLTFFVGTYFFNQTQSLLLGNIAFLVTLWTNEALPLGVVSLLPIILFPAFGFLSTKETTINYAHPIIYLFLGGFLLAIAVEKTKLHIRIANMILNVFPDTPRAMILSLAITAGLLSAILSNTTTTLLLITIAIFITQNEKLKLRFALAIAYGASIGGILTPIGTPPNLILLGIMQNSGLEMIPFMQWMVMVAPLCIVMIIAMSFLLSIGVKEIQVTRNIELPEFSLEQKKVAFLLLSLIALLIVNAPIKPYWNGLGLSESGVLLGFGLVLFMPPFKILDWLEDHHKVPYSVVMLFGAGFSIANAFVATGLADDIASYILGMTHFSPIVLLFSIAFMITFATEITSNTALVSIMLPVIYSVSEQAGINTTLFMMVATICGSYAFMLPIATPPNAIAMSSGVVHVKDMIRYGIVLNLLGIFFIVMIAEYFWKGVFFN